VPALLDEPAGHELDDHDRKLFSDVQRHGWHVVAIPAENDIPGWSFTVGLTHSFGVPELAIFGLSDDIRYTSLNIIGEFARAGEAPQLGSRLSGVLEGYDIVARAVDSAWNRAMFGYARWFYRQREPEFLECVWPDLSGRFPWEPEFEARHQRLQPALWTTPAQAP